MPEGGELIHIETGILFLDKVIDLITSITLPWFLGLIFGILIIVYYR
jgi:hypothetical protein